MIDENAEALARKERDDAQRNLDYEIAKNEGQIEASAHEYMLTEIILMATKLSEKIRELQDKEKIWDCILDGMNNYELENSDTKRECQFWIEKYGEKYAELR